MAQMYTEKLLGGKVPGQVGAGPIVEALSKEDLEFVVVVLNRFLSAIDYQKDEATLRAYVQVYLAAAGSGVEAEFEDDRRKELKVKVDGREWIFDFRIVKALKDASEHNVDADKHMEKIHPRDQDDRRDTRKVRLVF